MENNQKLIGKERILFFFLVSIILLLRLWNISELNAPWIFDDEMMYWTHAANMAGLSWTEVGTLWYSYGYSILLVPLFWITHNMNSLYRMAIVLNAVMGVAGFILGMAIIQEIDEKIDHITKMLVSFVAACYSAYIFQSNIAWTETFIYTWFLFILWSAIKFCKNTSWRNTVSLSLEIFFLYMIHNRNIIILIAYILTLLWMLYKKGIDWKKVCAAVLILAGGFVINSMIRQGLCIKMWGDADVFKGNNLATQGKEMRLLLSLEGWWLLIRSFAGKVWYILTATLMLAFPGAIYLGKKFVYSFSKKRERTSGSDGMSFFYLFLSLFVCATIAVSTIVMADLDMGYELRVDRYFYGRYSETILGILIMFGLIHIVSIMKKKECILECVAGLLFYLLCSVSLYLQISPYPFVNNASIAVNCVPGIFFFKEFSFFKCCGIVLFFYLAVNILFYFSDSAEKNVQAVKREGLCALVAVIFCVVAGNAYQVCIPMYQNTYKQVCTKITDIMEQNPQYTTYQFMDLDWPAKQIMRSRVVNGKIKYLLPDNSVDDVAAKGGFLASINDVVTHGLPDDMEENCFFVMEKRSEDKIDLSDKDLYYILADGSMVLMGIGEELAESVRAQGYSCSRIGNAKTKDPAEADILLEADDRKQVIKPQQELTVNAVLRDESESVVWNDRYMLSYHIYNSDGEPVLWDGGRFPIESFVGEQTVTMQINGENFSEIGEYVVEPALIEAGTGRWLLDTGGKTEKACVYVNGSWRFSDNQFVNNGQDENGIRKLNPGGFSYGPYWKARPGDYVLTINGENLDKAELFVTSALGQKRHDFTIITKKSEQIILSVSLSENVENLEVLIQNNTEEEIRLSGIEMECQGKDTTESGQMELEIGGTDTDETKEIKVGRELNFDAVLRVDGEDPEDNQYALSYHLYNGKGQPVLWEGEKVPIKQLQGEQEIPVTVHADYLNKIGGYTVEPALVEAETGIWLYDAAREAERLHVSVKGVWKFADNQFVNNGEDEDGVRSLHAGGLSYGPYWNVQEGDYVLTINGDNLELAEILVTSRFGEKNHDVTVIEEESGKVVLSVSLAEEEENLEILIQNPTEESIMLYDIEMKCAEL